MEVTSHAPGTFCWFELHTSDGAAAKAFYGGLFGWGADDMPMGEGMVYTLLTLSGKQVGGLFQDHEPGIPPHWLSYISVESADESTEKAKSLGASVAAGPFDVPEVGRMAVLQDPTGAHFALWQSKNHHGAQVVDEAGAFCWDELATRDCDTAAAFYTSLFGWTTHGEGYIEFHFGGRPIGGMMAITEQMGPVPPHWLAYFQVADCDAGAEKAKGLGGKVLVGPMDIQDVGRLAVIQDPQGAVFAIVKLGS